MKGLSELIVHLSPILKILHMNREIQIAMFKFYVFLTNSGSCEGQILKFQIQQIKDV